MFRNKIFLALVILVCPFLVPKSAQASSISLLGIDNISQNTSSITTGTNGKNVGSQSGYGGGVVVDFPIGMRLGFETGFLFFDRNWSDNNGANSLVSQVYEVPAMIKLHFAGPLAVGVGAYYTSEPNNLGETGSVNNSSLSYSNYGINSYDYGLRAEVTLHIPLSEALAFRVDGVYQYGLTNAEINTSNTFNYREIQVLAGFQFMLGSDRHR